MSLSWWLGSLENQILTLILQFVPQNLWMLVKISWNGQSWLWENDMHDKASKHDGINSNHTKTFSLEFSLQALLLFFLTGSFSGAVGTEAGNTAGTNDSVDQVSPTIPRATKNRVSGKLRRSASAISKSSAWAFEPVALFPLMQPLILSRRTSHTQPWLQKLFCLFGVSFFFFVWFYVIITCHWSVLQFLI